MARVVILPSSALVRDGLDDDTACDFAGVLSREFPHREYAAVRFDGSTFNPRVPVEPATPPTTTQASNEPNVVTEDTSNQEN